MITWKMIPQIEKAFGFRLYKWQRNYLLGNRRYRTKHRRNGNTFAYCVKLLLSGGESITINSLKLGLWNCGGIVQFLQLLKGGEFL